MLSSISLCSLLLLSASLSSALYAPRSRHAAHIHHAHVVKARDALPLPVPVPVAGANASVSRRERKRQAGQCRQRPSSAVPSSASSTAAPASSSAAPINVGQKPTTQVLPPSSSSSAPPAPSSSASHSSSSTFVPPPPPPPPKTSAQPTSQAPAPKPTSTAAPAPPPKPTQSQGSGNNGGGSGLIPFPGFFVGPNNGGDATFYTPGLGACGGNNNENEFVCALPHGLFDNVPGYNGANPNNNPVCNKHITVTYQGKSVRLQVVDECEGCDNNNSVDMSPAAFQQLAPLGAGRLHGISWVWS